MCVVSMVHDYYAPRIPDNVYSTGLAQMLEDFCRAKEAAEVVDKLTNQPDCIDPLKATLSERVAKLEKELSELKERIGL